MKRFLCKIIILLTCFVLQSSKSPTCSRGLPDIADAKLLSPCGLFLSPRTPKPVNERDCAKASSASACLTPSNFASDFGKGHKQTPSFDACNGEYFLKDISEQSRASSFKFRWLTSVVTFISVFAWLNSPTGQGLFSPSGGLTTLSVTNTPRGMYGFSGGGKTPYTPSTTLAPSTNSSSFFFSDVEGLPSGEAEIASPKDPDNQRSMICISPLASQKSGGTKHERICSAPDTPMSINFNDVFASPGLTTPCPNRTSSIKKDGTSNPSPVVSALHTAERDLMEDADLNVLLQLAGTTTPSGRPISFLSPLLTNSLRKASLAGPKIQ